MDLPRLNDSDVPERKHVGPTCKQTTGQTESPHDLSANFSAFASLPRLRKNLLYSTISLALALDIFATWGLFTPLDLVARDLGLAEGGNAVWIVSAYAMAFAACIPLGGRLCDVFPAQWWFVGGFAGMAGLSLGLSFIHERKAFLSLRALQGICGALTLPSGFSMIVHLFPDKQEQQSRLIGISVVFTLGCASAFCLGALLTLAHWRWIFRFSACTSSVGASVGWLLLPKAIRAKRGGSTSRRTAAWKLVKRLDVVGVALVMGALLLFNLALTSATVHGWSSPHFIIPIILAALLFPSFCYWEARQDVRYAMLPVAIMKERRFLVLCCTGVCAEMWFCMTQLGPSRFFQEVLHDPILVVAGKLSTPCLGCVIGGLVHTFYISKTVPAKFRLLGGMVRSIVPSLVLLILSDGGRGVDFWRFMFPAQALGAFFWCITFQVCNILIIQSVPAEYSGVGSSVFQMCAQTGIVIGSAVQAALYTAREDGIADWRAHQYGLYFLIGCMIVGMTLVAMFLPSSKKAAAGQVNMAGNQSREEVRYKANESSN